MREIVFAEKKHYEHTLKYESSVEFIIFDPNDECCKFQNTSHRTNEHARFITRYTTCNKLNPIRFHYDAEFSTIEQPEKKYIYKTPSNNEPRVLLARFWAKTVDSFVGNDAKAIGSSTSRRPADRPSRDCAGPEDRSERISASKVQKWIDRIAYGRRGGFEAWKNSWLTATPTEPDVCVSASAANSDRTSRGPVEKGVFAAAAELGRRLQKKLNGRWDKFKINTVKKKRTKRTRKSIRKLQKAIGIVCWKLDGNLESNY